MKWISTWWFWCGLGFLLYVNTLKHEYTIDDLIVVTSNKLTQQGVSAIPDIFSHSYMFGYNGRENEAKLLYEKILKVDPNQAHTKELYEKLRARMK